MKKTVRGFLVVTGATLALGQNLFTQILHEQKAHSAKSKSSTAVTRNIQNPLKQDEMAPDLSVQAEEFLNSFGVNTVDDPWPLVSAWNAWMGLDEALQNQVDQAIVHRFQLPSLREALWLSIERFNGYNHDIQAALALSDNLAPFASYGFPAVVIPEEIPVELVEGIPDEEWVEEPQEPAEQEPEGEVPEDQEPGPDEDQEGNGENQDGMPEDGQPDLPDDEEERIRKEQDRIFENWRESFSNRFLDQEQIDLKTFMEAFREYTGLEDWFRERIDNWVRDYSQGDTFYSLVERQILAFNENPTSKEEALAIEDLLKQIDGWSFTPVRIPEEEDLPKEDLAGSIFTEENREGSSTSQKKSLGDLLDAQSVHVASELRNRLSTGLNTLSKTTNAKLKIGGIGEINLLPDFTNALAWKESKSSYNTPILWGQCTWFAWGRFYEIYGFSPGFTGNGYECAGQLVAAHPDLFELSDRPKPGAVFSSDPAHNHVGLVLSVDEKKDELIIQEGNLDIVSNPIWSDAIDDWRSVRLSLDDLKALYGNVVFANPKAELSLEDFDIENPKLADLFALTDPLDPLAVNRYADETSLSPAEPVPAEEIINDEE